MSPVEVVSGDGPVILGQPHGGTHVPEALVARLNANGRALADTDWHIGRLYEGLLPVLRALRPRATRAELVSTARLVTTVIDGALVQLPGRRFADDAVDAVLRIAGGVRRTAPATRRG